MYESTDNSVAEKACFSAWSLWPTVAEAVGFVEPLRASGRAERANPATALAISLCAASSEGCIMDSNPVQIQRELAKLVYDEADAAEKRTLTDSERREREKRQKRINALCEDLRRIAAQTHDSQGKKVT